MSIKICSIFVVIILLKVAPSKQQTDSSFDSLVASQCRARCLSLYPWNILDASNLLIRKRDLFSNIQNNVTQMFETKVYKRDSVKSHHKKNQRGHVKWNKIMELCSKNTNCLQCTLPCDIPTNLLSNCKYLCKNRNQLCLDSCELLTQLNEKKYGKCPSFSFTTETKSSIELLLTDPLKQSNSLNQCSNHTKALAVAALLKNNNENQLSKPLAQCNADSECGEINKCCLINSACPQHGYACAKPIINEQDLASAPFNLTIIERKKGKTVILNWDCVYNKNKPTIFVVEGRWSLKSPDSTEEDEAYDSDSDNQMTKWGYLAQTVNNNWIILRNINRGRWYKFRVASITKSGTHGYSKATDLFILSAAPKPPIQPQNLSIVQIYPNNDGLFNKLNADITWQPSIRSDLPIVHYKISWNVNMLDSSNIDLPLSNGYDFVDAQNLNKYTIKDLNINSIYTIEIAAVSKYNDKFLYSAPLRIQMDTSSSNKKVTTSTEHSLVDKTEYHDNDYEESDKEDYQEDENLEISREKMFKDQQIFTRNSPTIDQTTKMIDLMFQKRIQNSIRNLTIKEPYFRNGLVKAKLSWIYEQSTSSINSESSSISASINSIIIEQPMFTITWFPIKCLKHQVKADSLNLNDDHVTLSSKQLPTPITATTINTNFEIYELKYNCDYVVNVRLAQKILSDSLNSLQPKMAPQISSGQFKVPQCNLVKYIGNIRPLCYSANNEKNSLSTLNSIKHTTNLNNISAAKTTKIESIIFKKDINLFSRTIYDIRHRIVEKNSEMKFYSVEFLWSLIEDISISEINGYQISVVPKAIPGFGSLNLNDNEDNLNNFGTSFGSVGAIVAKEQNSFVVKQLRSSVKYIFQIQLIGLDNQLAGPVSSFEFIINTEENEHKNSDILINQPRQDKILKENDVNDAYYDYESSLLASTMPYDLKEELTSSSTAIKSKFYFYLLYVIFLLKIFYN